MPSPIRSKKALQEIARVFNKLASELASELNQAAREIESLKREVHRLKTSSGSRPAKSPSTSHHRSANRSPRAPKTGTEPHQPSHLTSTETQHPAHHETPHHETPKPAHGDSSYVFPHEPFSPTSQPETSHSGNN